jgi:hypothetical protein
MSPLELLAQPLPELPLPAPELGRQLEGEVEIPVIDCPDLDPEPASQHGILRSPESGHTVGQIRAPGRGN